MLGGANILAKSNLHDGLQTKSHNPHRPSQVPNLNAWHIWTGVTERTMKRSEISMGRHSRGETDAHLSSHDYRCGPDRLEGGRAAFKPHAERADARLGSVQGSMRIGSPDWYDSRQTRQVTAWWSPESASAPACADRGGWNA